MQLTLLGSCCIGQHTRGPSPCLSRAVCGRNMQRGPLSRQAGLQGGQLGLLPSQLLGSCRQLRLEVSSHGHQGLACHLQKRSLRHSIAASGPGCKFGSHCTLMPPQPRASVRVEEHAARSELPISFRTACHHVMAGVQLRMAAPYPVHGKSQPWST